MHYFIIIYSSENLDPSKKYLPSIEIKIYIKVNNKHNYKHNLKNIYLEMWQNKNEKY